MVQVDEPAKEAHVGGEGAALAQEVGEAHSNEGEDRAVGRLLTGHGAQLLLCDLGVAAYPPVDAVAKGLSPAFSLLELE